MAGSSLLVLIDDIATLLDDVASMTKVAARKTAGVLGDDLALNAEQVSGVRAERELPVIWAVAKGSLINKIILVPGALLISYFIPWLIVPLLMLGGLFLCFEGVEKLLHSYLHEDCEAAQEALKEAFHDEAIDLVAFEKAKIKGAIRTDFILSAEIIVITLGTVAGAHLITQFAVLAGISFLVTVCVYGLVAGIVKLDDLGLYLIKQTSVFKKTVGEYLLVAAPWLMKTLAVVGTAAMFMVGGGILTHGIPLIHHTIDAWAQYMENVSNLAIVSVLVATILEALCGVFIGALAVALFTCVKKCMRLTSAPK